MIDIWTNIVSALVSVWNVIVSICSPVLSALMTYILAPIGHCFAVGYNFIQTNPFFAKNAFNFIIVAGGFIFCFFFFNVVSIFEKKSQEIINTITKSETDKDKAISHLKETKKSLANIDNDIKKIMSDAKVLAENIDKNNEEKMQEELKNLENRANVLKAGYEQKAQKEVEETIAKAAIAVSKEYIVNSLDENSQKELIYNFINNLESMRVE